MRSRGPSGRLEVGGLRPPDFPPNSISAGRACCDPVEAEGRGDPGNLPERRTSDADVSNDVARRTKFDEGNAPRAPAPAESHHEHGTDLRGAGVHHEALRLQHLRPVLAARRGGVPELPGQAPGPREALSPRHALDLTLPPPLRC